jgi:hypothetical protein
MLNIEALLELHRSTVARWHNQPIDNPYRGLLSTIATQHAFNYQLWHEEDVARSPDADNATIAAVKRRIDFLNQQRNDWIEHIDDDVAAWLDHHGVRAGADAPMNTETLGGAIDRLSILALRIYHLSEQICRDGADAAHIESVGDKLRLANWQQMELARAVDQLIDDIRTGRRIHRTYRQLKMYNDPSLNPYLYNARAPAA